MFVGCINTENSKIEVIKENCCTTYYLITLENGDLLYGTVNQWFAYPSGDQAYSDDISSINEIVYWHFG